MTQSVSSSPRSAKPRLLIFTPDNSRPERNLSLGLKNETQKLLDKVSPHITRNTIISSILVILIVTLSGVFFSLQKVETRLANSSSSQIKNNLQQQLICDELEIKFESLNEDVEKMMHFFSESISTLNRIESASTDLKDYVYDIVHNQTQRLHLLEQNIANFTTSTVGKKSLSITPSVSFEKPNLANYEYGARFLPKRSSKEILPTASHPFVGGLLNFADKEHIPLMNGPLKEMHCWCFAGSEGTYAVNLSSKAYPREIVYQHFHWTSALPPKSAPKDIEVLGCSSQSDSCTHLGICAYNSSEIMKCVLNPASKLVQIVEFVIHSNHGNEYTCLYRFRVHGTVSEYY